MLEWAGERAEFRVQILGPKALRVSGPEAEHHVEFHGNTLWLDGVQTVASVHAAQGQITVFFGNTYVFRRVDPLDQASASVGDGAVLAPMPGLVKALFVSPGDAIEEGAQLAVLEAMKMEHILVASHAGKVGEVLVREGAQVDAGAELVRMADE